MDNEVSFLKSCFAEYYSNHGVTPPERFDRREYAFMPFGAKLMKRHISFKRRKDLQSFITKMVPAHIYYSSAFYRYPDAPTMEEKGWMGAELIFDLDMDHLKKGKNLKYEDGLKLVKEEFKRLVEDFLLNDFGFEKRYIKLFFSGGRGYHCHVTDPKVLQLDGNERREIVDYITGIDLDENLVFRKRVLDVAKVRGRKVAKSYRLEIPKPDEPGWRGRIGRSVLSIIESIARGEEDKLKEIGISRKDLEKLREELSRERLERIMKEGLIDQSTFIKKFFLRESVRRVAISSVTGETDEPVTCDIKRLIRLPSSLHGKTGLKVCEIDINGIDDFNPLSDAVVFDDEKIEIVMEKNLSIEMNGEKFELKKGECKVPKYLAVFLVGRGMAKVKKFES